jgi:competence protein ComEC
MPAGSRFEKTIFSTRMHPNSSIHWNAYPSAVAALFLVAGIASAERLGFSILVWTGAGCVWAAIGLWSLYPVGLLETKRGWLVLSAFACIYCAGAVRYVDFVDPATADLSMLPAEAEVGLVGRPTAAAATSSGVRFFLDVDSVYLGRYRHPLVNRVQVYLRDHSPGAINPCVRIRVGGRLDDLPAVRNPGEFDYGGYLRGRRVFFRLFADGRSGVEVYRGDTAGLSCIAYRLKSEIVRRFERSVEDRAARSVILALVVGDRSGIDKDVEERFRRTGLLHLLAVSGLHVLIVGMIFYQLLRPMLLRFGLSRNVAEATRTIATAMILALYALVTGLPASVVRAVVMAVLFMAAAVFQRSAHSLNTLGVSVIVLLIARPPQVFEPGFQLSVAAVAAIISLQSRFESLFRTDKSEGYIRQTIRASTTVSLAASAGTLPVLLFHFGSVSFAGLILNTVAVPLTSATLASSVTTAGAAGLSEGIGLILGQTSQLFAQFLLFLVEHGEPYFRWAYVEWPVSNVIAISALVVSLFAIAQWPRPRSRWRLLSLVLTLLCSAIVVDAGRGALRARLSVLFLDVGQGDAAVIRFPNGKTLLLDAGPRSPYTDAGMYTILPLLQRNRIRRLDGILITHPDSDHLGGLPAILRNVDVGRIIHCGLAHGSALYAETVALIDSLEIPYSAARTGDTLAFDSSTRVHILHPDRPLPDEKPNASSIVMRLQYGRTAFLMMGDAEAAAERTIVRRYGDLLDVDVVKIGHHGSETSSTPILASRAFGSDPIAIISVGKRNRYGLPDSSVVRKLFKEGALVRRTDRHGAVWLESDGSGVVERRWR